MARKSGPPGGGAGAAPWTLATPPAPCGRCRTQAHEAHASLAHSQRQFGGCISGLAREDKPSGGALLGRKEHRKTQLPDPVNQVLPAGRGRLAGFPGLSILHIPFSEGLAARPGHGGQRLLSFRDPSLSQREREWGRETSVGCLWDVSQLGTEPEPPRLPARPGIRPAARQGTGCRLSLARPGPLPLLNAPLLFTIASLPT